jgi:DNA-binding NtrC family response regulator
VIDDEPDMLEALDSILSSAGYEVSTAESGDAAVQQAKRSDFDLAITDMRMPGMSGVDTVAALRQIDPDLVMIVLSGYVSEESAVRCSEEGAIRIVSKPCNIDELLHVVEGALERAAPT